MSEGRLTVVTGQSRWGKSYFVNQQIKKCPRVLVYDPKGKPDEWPGLYKVKSIHSMIAAMKKTGKGPGRYRLIDEQLQHFDHFCRAALVWSKQFGPCVIIADELAEVTSPSKAPKGWGTVCRTVLGFGSDVYAVTQRPAESDKTCFGNASEFVCFGMARKRDREYMAAEMDIDVRFLSSLQKYECIRREVGGDWCKQLKHGEQLTSSDIVH